MTALSIKQLLHSSLEGRDVIVFDHPDPGLHGIAGTIVRETSQTISIEVNERIIGVSKLGRFRFKTGDDYIDISGELLQGLPKRRRKRKLRTW